jgi:uncharacterized protein (DUF952 family)
VIFYLLTADEWAATDGDVVARPGDEGFVHCCAERQVDFVRRAYFPADTSVVALGLDPTTLQAETRFEWGAGGEQERFPHVYGAIPRSAVTEVRPL